MFNHMPSALLLPVTINNSWKTMRYGKFPMGIGAHIKFKVHQPIKISAFEDKIDLIKKVEDQITASIKI